MSDLLPFPSIREPRFRCVGDAMAQRTPFGWEHLSDQDALDLNHILRLRADRHDRDGHPALARLHRDYMGQLTKAWGDACAYRRARTGYSSTLETVPSRR
ncbi:hypothetical protein [Asticcacaulis sp. AC466]|uniref:hypothetical protein n=1 Tax=Asticcacaulis sp. AC466 TaxID=1282362 RepID=UPI0012DC8404|nr:hypothetical protein [Asticcacaulis sp. AC466]